MADGHAYTERAAAALAEADRVAQLFRHEYLGTDHILLGLVQAGGAAANVLANLGVTPDAVRELLGRIIQHGPDGDLDVIGRRPLTPRTEKALGYSAEEARGHDHIGTEHLLLGLLREKEAVAFQVLEHLGAGLERVRAEVQRRRPAPPGWRTADVTALAQGISAEGAYDRLPILADALQDAGCDDAEALDHLRREPHGCRAGCWVLDRLLDADRPSPSGEPGAKRSNPDGRQPRRWWRLWR